MSRRKSSEKIAGGRFPYAERAAAVRKAWAAIGPAFKAVANRRDEHDPKTVAWKNAIRAAFATLDAAYPPDFEACFSGLKKGQGSGIDPMIEFLEADPIFFRSGYVKADIMRHLKRASLTSAQAERLRAVLKRIVLDRDTASSGRIAGSPPVSTHRRFATTCAPSPPFARKVRADERPGCSKHSPMQNAPLAAGVRP